MGTFSPTHWFIVLVMITPLLVLRSCPPGASAARGVQWRLGPADAGARGGPGRCPRWFHSSSGPATATTRPAPQRLV